MCNKYVLTLYHIVIEIRDKDRERERERDFYLRYPCLQKKRIIYRVSWNWRYKREEDDSTRKNKSKM